jgi:calcineurin-like phosphoesterase family protein
MEFWTSDTHFGQKNIIKLHNRPFGSVAEMDDTMIDNINRIVNKNDTLHHLGDFASGSVEKAIKYRKRINCKNLLLIYGNHDYKNRTFKEFRKAFGRFNCHDIHEIKRNGRLLVMCHYPFLYPHHWDKGAWNLHGHLHGEGDHHPTLPVVDVGVDVWNYSPLTYKEISLVIEKNIYKLPYQERYKALKSLT